MSSNYHNLKQIFLNAGARYKKVPPQLNQINIKDLKHSLIGVQWLGTKCQIKHVRQGILQALNWRYPRI